MRAVGLSPAPRVRSDPRGNYQASPLYLATVENVTMPRTMNDPHVVALTFRIEHDSSVAYRADAPPIQHQEEAFRVTLEDGTVRFELEEHHATEEGALEPVLPYVRSWELDACLRGRPGDFRLQFQQAEIIDRNPPPPEPGFVDISASGIAAVGTLGSVSLTVVKPSYPSPPSGQTLNADDPDVATMYDRLSGYYAKREPLPSMASFCLTVLEWRFTKKRRRNVAKVFHIEKAVLDKIGELAATKGGAASARKAEGVGTDLSPKETRFLEEAVKTLIRRAAEVTQNPGGTFATITLGDLPDRP